jgi:hypothetical protein
MRLSAEKLWKAMTNKGLDDIGLANLLRKNGLDVSPNVVKKWCKALQPASDKIKLIELVLGSKITEDEKPRRSFIHPNISAAA